MAEKSRNGKVTVVGAGFYGSTTAQRLAEYDIFETVVLTDIVEGKPEGLALDMNQSRPIEGFETKVVGPTTGPDGSGYEAIAGSDVVVITAGLPRKPGMSRMDLHRDQRQDRAPGRRERRQARARRRRHRRVQPARRDDRAGPARHRVPEEPGASARPACSTPPASPTSSPRSSACRSASVQTLTLGSHGDTMVPVPSRCTVDGKPLSDAAAAGQDRGAGRPHPQRRRRGRGAAQDRLGVLRAVGRRRPHGQGRRRGLRRGHAGLRLGRRRVRHLRRLPGRRGRDRPRGRASRSSRAT